MSNRTIAIPMPTQCKVLVYYSDTKLSWVTHVIVTAINAEHPEAFSETFGSIWDHSEEPTVEKIREHVVNFLDHEVQHRLGMDPHGVERSPVARIGIMPRVHAGDFAGHVEQGDTK